MSDFIKELLSESEEEKRINAEIEALRETHETSDAEREYRDKMDKLYDELNDARKKRTSDVREKYNRSCRRKKIGHENEEDFNVKLSKYREEKQAKRKAEFDKLHSAMQKNIEFFNCLDKDSQQIFFNFADIKRNEDYELIDNYHNPITTKEDMHELSEILGQTCIDFINARGLTDIDMVSFHVDGLMTSAKYGEITPSSDGSIKIEGLQQGADKYMVRRLIGKTVF